MPQQISNPYGISSVKTGIEYRKTGADSASDKDMFLKLMIAQLKNQDPSSPMDSKDMMASITQMSQVEQMMNQTKALTTLSLTQSVGMVDKEIQFSQQVKTPDGGVYTRTAVGKVTHVTQENGSVKLAVKVSGTLDSKGFFVPAVTQNTISVDVNDVTLVGGQRPPEAPTTPTTGGGTTTNPTTETTTDPDAETEAEA